MCVFYFITQNIKEKCNQGSRCNKINQFLLHVKDILNWNWHFFFLSFFFFKLQACDNEGYNSSKAVSCHWFDSCKGTSRFTRHCFCSFGGNVYRVEGANKIIAIHLTVVLSLQDCQKGVQGFLDQTLRTALSGLCCVEYCFPSKRSLWKHSQLCPRILKKKEKKAHISLSSV